ncbi:MAG: hypothetical protein E7566_03980 [Ruminococcaceae bacterium]|nr:hypothetical protein [Oscillospiraceae bacterium]
MKITIKVLAFILILLLTAIPLTSAAIVGIGNTGEIKACANELYSLERNTIDALYIGSSSTWAGVSPLVIYNQTGITGFNRSCTVQASYTAYFYLLEALEYQTPKIVILEGETLFTDYNENFVRTAIDSMKNSDVKKEAINFFSDFSDTPLYTKASYYVPFLYYSKSWSELKPEEVFLYYSKRNSDYNSLCPMGGRLNTNVCTFDWPEENFTTTDEVADVDPVNEEYFLKILKLCKEKGIEVMVVTYPNADATYARYNKLTELCKEQDVMYCDMRLIMDEVGVDPKVDFSDEGEHTNVKGNIKISNYLAKLLSENFDLPDRRGTEGYEYYDKYLETFLNENGKYLN